MVPSAAAKPRQSTGPLLVMGAGAILLLSTLGLLDISVWQLLWPLALIGIGVWVLIGRVSPEKVKPRPATGSTP